MPLNLTTIAEEKTAWYECTGPLEGVRLLLRYHCPREEEKFHRRLIARGIARRSAGGIETVAGKREEICLAFAEHYIIGWDGEITPEGAPYSPEAMAGVLMSVDGLDEDLLRAIKDGQRFFPRNRASGTAL